MGSAASVIVFLLLPLCDFDRFNLFNAFNGTSLEFWVFAPDSER